MYAPSFDYYRAGSMTEAQKLLQQHPGAKVLAGGHSLIPLLKLRLTAPPALIDIGRIPELKGINTSDGTIRIGALTTHAELASSPALKSGCPMVSEAAAQIGDAQVRNCGTIGGNVAHADPASDLPTVLLALGARFTAVGPKGERTIAAGDFFQGMMATALGEYEILAAIEVPAKKSGEGMAYAKFVHPASRYAVVGAAAVVTMKDGACTAARVAIGGLLPAASRARAVEAALVGARPSPDTIAKAAELVSKDLGADVLGDIFASAEYRRAMAAVFVKRALTTAFARVA
jgi:aerobic carbon-monoxide dehydrogenase medium subunit